MPIATNPAGSAPRQIGRVGSARACWSASRSDGTGLCPGVGGGRSLPAVAGNGCGVPPDLVVPATEFNYITAGILALLSVREWLRGGTRWLSLSLGFGLLLAIAAFCLGHGRKVLLADRNAAGERGAGCADRSRGAGRDADRACGCG